MTPPKLNHRKMVRDILSDDVSHRERREWLSSASIVELEEFLHSVSVHQSEYQYACTELESRLAHAAMKPHWSVVPTFWLVVVSVLLGAVAVVLAVLR
jgi:hypothetical protein